MNTRETNEAIAALISFMGLFHQISVWAIEDVEKGINCELRDSVFMQKLFLSSEFLSDRRYWRHLPGIFYACKKAAIDKIAESN